jgi:hypothetical protein
MGVLDNLADFFTEDTQDSPKQKKATSNSRGKKGGSATRRGLAAADMKTRARVARAGGKATRAGGRK